MLQRVVHCALRSWQALVEALSTEDSDGSAGTLSFAGDVFAVEPLPADSGLWEKSNCLISSHCMDWTAEAKQLTADAWVKNVEAYARSGEAGLAGVVEPTLGY